MNGINSATNLVNQFGRVDWGEEHKVKKVTFKKQDQFGQTKRLGRIGRINRSL